ncbi:hypothetical protein [Agaribacterium haliotis]|uniref:hypothetical protein n=1 Tax=Agaribacterium haliotis TaxID=2013869 RepID=UPI000BB5337F|nr:hypothetical protein [Agaribacterium haliotis]
MKALWLKYSDAFNLRPLRERLLIALCILAFVYVCWELLIYSSINSENKKLQQRFSSAESALERLTQEEKIYTKTLMNNPNALKQKQVLELESKLQNLDQELAELSVGLVQARELPQIIRSMLQKREKLSLLAMQALPPQRLSFDTAKNTDSDADEDEKPELSAKPVGVFKHSVRFRLEGSYFELTRYLQELEQGDWQFYWSSLAYEVTSWPTAMVELEAYTLSTQRGFIGE